MIQINLLPDIKKEYLKAQQLKHTVIVVSILAVIVSLSLLALLFAYVSGVQPRHQANLQKDIDESISSLQQKPDAVKMVTVQGALETLPKLEDTEPQVAKLFTYLTQFTPRGAGYSTVKLDLTTNSLTLAGVTDDYETANELANILKTASMTYLQQDTEAEVKPFSSVVFSNLARRGIEGEGQSGGVDFALSVIIDPILFNQSISDVMFKFDASSDAQLNLKKPFTNAQETLNDPALDSVGGQQ